MSGWVAARKCPGGVPIGGIVAAADVPAGHAHAQVQPVPTDTQEILATVTARRDVVDPIEVCTAVAHLLFDRATATWLVARLAALSHSQP
jgi:hypothetical protein